MMRIGSLRLNIRCFLQQWLIVHRTGQMIAVAKGFTPPPNRHLPEWLDPLNVPPTANPRYLEAWGNANGVPNPSRGTPGDYVIDNTMISNTCTRGEAYLVDRVILGADKTGAGDKISLAARVTAGGISADPPTTAFTSWVSMPKAVAVFHTVIGE
jgi:hypothetical protein